jgi:thiamine-phosphate pyrophosphorylase
MIKRYLITDPAFYTSNARLCAQKIIDVSEVQPVDFICLRDKTHADYDALAKAVIGYLPQSLHVKMLLHTHYTLAHDLGLYGVHLPSNAYDLIAKAKALNLFVVVSTHTLEEALMAQKEGADAITFSPIFHSPNKGEPVGLEKLKEINDRIAIKCFALGGIVTAEHVKACEALNLYGFASIRFFLD